MQQILDVGQPIQVGIPPVERQLIVDVGFGKRGKGFRKVWVTQASGFIAGSDRKLIDEVPQIEPVPFAAQPVVQVQSQGFVEIPPEFGPVATNGVYEA